MKRLKSFINSPLSMALFVCLTIFVIIKLSFLPNEFFKNEFTLEGPIPSDDALLIKYIQSVILPPPMEKYNVTTELKQDTSNDYLFVLNKVLEKKENGFFVDYGPYDVNNNSTTLYLEKYLNWTGLVIETNLERFTELKTKHRKAYILNGCLSDKEYLKQVAFNTKSSLGKKALYGRKDDDTSEMNCIVQCFPLCSLLLALNRLDVDFFNLDVDGFEFQVLNGIPFEKMNIKVVMVKLYNYYEEFIITELMKRKEYDMFSKFNNITLVFTKNQSTSNRGGFLFHSALHGSISGSSNSIHLKSSLKLLFN